jgi:hypothetical protein
MPGLDVAMVVARRSWLEIFSVETWEKEERKEMVSEPPSSTAEIR